jgi:hypothetical protein
MRTLNFLALVVRAAALIVAIAAWFGGHDSDGCGV